MRRRARIIYNAPSGLAEVIPVCQKFPIKFIIGQLFVKRAQKELQYAKKRRFGRAKKKRRA